MDPSLSSFRSPLERLQRIREMLAELEADHIAARAELRKARAVAVRELLAEGHSLAEIAAELGVNRQRVHQFSRE